MTDILSIVHDGPVLRLTLNRPERRNALSKALVQALSEAFASIDTAYTRVVVLAGNGPAFCAGGDIAEFVAAAGNGTALADAESLAALLNAIAACPLPVVARVHGSVYGGGVGLVCATDLVIACDDTRFSLSEARLGLVPAVISPFVVGALGAREARVRMLLASPFDASEGLRIGLVNEIASADQLDTAVDRAIADLLKSPPGALAIIKRVPSLVTGDPDSIRRATTELLSERLASDEGQEGLRAFLEKRSANWVPRS